MTITIILCLYYSKKHEALDFRPVDANIYKTACPETGETIRLRVTAKQKRPGLSEVK